MKKSATKMRKSATKIEKSATKMKKSEHSQFSKKRKRAGSAGDKGVSEKIKHEPSLQQKRGKEVIIGFVLSIIFCIIDLGIIILIWYLFSSHKEVTEKLDKQLIQINELKKCNVMNTGLTATFSASYATGYVGSFKEVNINQTAKFDHVLANEGKGYDRQTGYFTAATPGLYHFQINVAAYHTDEACLSLTKDNGERLVTAYAEGGSWETGSTSAVIELAAGEGVAAVACKASRFSTNVTLGQSTTFSGYLVYASDCVHTRSAVTKLPDGDIHSPGPGDEDITSPGPGDEDITSPGPVNKDILSPIPGVYIGCFEDKFVNADRDIGTEHHTFTNNTRDLCVTTCSRNGYKYAGLQFATSCFCGNSYGKYGSKGASECDTKCPGNESQTCGGTVANQLYWTRKGGLKFVCGRGRSNLNIDCSDTFGGKGVININTVSYGRTDRRRCPIRNGLKTDCFDNAINEKHTNAMSKSCNNKPECDYDINNSVATHGDPCPGTHKYTTVDYSCVQGPVCPALFDGHLTERQCEGTCDSWGDTFTCIKASDVGTTTLAIKGNNDLGAWSSGFPTLEKCKEKCLSVDGTNGLTLKSLDYIGGGCYCSSKAPGDDVKLTGYAMDFCVRDCAHKLR